MRPGEFVTADTHFGHSNVIKFSNRPFTDVDEMNEELIERWNAKIPIGGIVYHLGDFSFLPKERTQEILWQLNGTIRLVRGNHDRRIKGELLKEFEWVKDYYESKLLDHTKVVMCHYAFRTWNASHYGSWNLHGHSHGSLNSTGMRQMDVGVDNHPNLEPFSFEEVQEYMAGRGHEQVDHHRQR